MLMLRAVWCDRYDLTAAIRECANELVRRTGIDVRTARRRLSNAMCAELTAVGRRYGMTPDAAFNECDHVRYLHFLAAARGWQPAAAWAQICRDQDWRLAAEPLPRVIGTKLREQLATLLETKQTQQAARLRAIADLLAP